MTIVRRIVGLPYRFGGEQHVGWLPESAAMPLPTPVRDVLLDLEIEFDGDGYLFTYVAHDGSFAYDTWHATLELAVQQANVSLGVHPSQWQCLNG